MDHIQEMKKTNKNRNYDFCNYVCDKFKELDNNSWSDCRVYYRCMQNGNENINSQDWEKETVPDNCKFKETYALSDKKTLDNMAKLALCKKYIEDNKTKKEALLKEIKNIDIVISDYESKILQIEYPYYCDDADILCRFQDCSSFPISCRNNMKCKHQKKKI